MSGPFWFWVCASQAATQWEVSRDGEVVATVAGPSFYESGLKELTSYLYSVTPMDADGERGPAAPYQGSVMCPGGGEANAVRTPFEYGVTAGGVTLSFDNCLVDNYRWNGSVQYSQRSFIQQTGSEGELASCTSTLSDLNMSDRYLRIR